jgi:methyl-accepting chemotaxis protein
MIESSQMGLQSLQYYTNATGVAARRLNSVGLQLLQQEQYLDPRSQVKQNLKEVTATAVYIQNAAAHQDASSKDLATAIRVTTQVAEQLATGAESATNASLQLEQVVEQLREIVGR